MFNVEAVSRKFEDAGNAVEPWHMTQLVPDVQIDDAAMLGRLLEFL